MSSEGIKNKGLGSILSCFKPKAYDLFIDLDHTKKNFVGEVTIQLEKTQVDDDDDNGPLKIVLNSNELVILGATSNNEKATVSYQRDVQRIVLSFANINANSVETGKLLDVTVKYIGKINRINTYKEKTRGLFVTNYLDQTTGKASNNIIATQSQPCDSRTIFPCIDELAATATVKLTLQLCLRFSAVSNALILDEEFQEDSGKVVIKFAKTQPMVISLFGFVCGDMEYLESQVSLDNATIPLRIYVLKGNLSKAHYALAMAKHFLPVLESKLKSKLPLPKLDIAGLPFLSNGAVENWSLINIQQDILLAAAHEIPLYKNRIRQLNQIIVHELVHQWFGNYVSFDSWNHYWLNEALATFLAYSLLDESDFQSLPYSNIDFNALWAEQATLMESVFDNDASKDISISTISENVQNINIDSIDRTFDQLSYEKGIFLLRMFTNVFDNLSFNDSNSKFFNVLGKLVEKLKYQTVKPVDYWMFFDELKDSSIGFSLVDFAVSWVRLPGFPVVSVSLTEDSLIKVEQHRFIPEDEPQDKYEDYVYQVPLAVTLSNGQVSNLLLKERFKVFTKEELDPKLFVKINANRTGYYKVKYDNLKFYQQIVQNTNVLTKLDWIGLLLDVESYIGTPYQSAVDTEGLIEILKWLVDPKTKLPPFEAVEILLRIFQFFSSAVQLFKNEKEYAELKEHALKRLAKKLFAKFHWPLNYQKVAYSKAEITCRNMILLLGVETPEIIGYCKQLFKNLNHGPKQSVPRELVSAVLINYVYNTDVKGFKKALQVSTRSSEALLININNQLEPESPVSVGELQSAAISALGFARNESLLQKTLNYVATNIDSKGIELALVGFNYFDNNKDYQNNRHKAIVWNWFSLHFDQWAARSLREGSEYSQQLYVTLHSLCETIAKSFTAPADVALIEQFIQSKNKQFGKHNLKSLHENALAGLERSQAVSKYVESNKFVL